MNKFWYKFIEKHYTWLSKFLFIFDVMLIMGQEEKIMTHKMQLELNRNSKYFNNLVKDKRYYAIDVEQIKIKGEEE